jgi:hypothetical protein
MITKDQLRLEFAFVAAVRRCEEVENVWILGGLLGEVRVRRRQGRREVGDGLAGALMEFRFDVMQYVMGPPVFDGGRRLPESRFRIAELLKQGDVATAMLQAAPATLGNQARPRRKISCNASFGVRIRWRRGMRSGCRQTAGSLLWPPQPCSAARCASSRPVAAQYDASSSWLPRQ